MGGAKPLSILYPVCYVKGNRNVSSRNAEMIKKTLLIATNNPGKILEFRSFLADLPVELLSLSDITNITEVEETGSTFEENARSKAAGYAVQAHRVALADDSGLEVAALAGRPGVHSARYGGADKSFEQKMTMLLDELEQVGDERRMARFVCAMSVADERGNILCTTRGTCSGRIALQPRGNNGFGYDPIFVPDGYEETFGQLTDAVKAKISHRAQAFDRIIPILRGLLLNMT